MSYEGFLVPIPAALELVDHEFSDFFNRDVFQDNFGSNRGVYFQLSREAPPGERSRAHDNPLKIRFLDEPFLVFLVPVTVPCEKRIDKPVVNDTAMAPGLTGAHASYGYQLPGVVFFHGFEQSFGDVREQGGRGPGVHAQRHDNNVRLPDELAQLV